METTTIQYDEISDTLTVVFESGTPSLGVELTNNILLRINPQTRQAVSLNFFDYSILSQITNIGSRSFPLTELRTLSNDLQETTIQILRSKPVCDFLQVSAYSPSITETIPIILLQPVVTSFGGSVATAA
ncbi:MAG: hypothetical protein SFY66_07165 [Oculatellaceae cyanobacterium bins.114]|nr:hypothetical protein [Oculatellaceae cyanobacterium bins.114]